MDKVQKKEIIDKLISDIKELCTKEQTEIYRENTPCIEDVINLLSLELTRDNVGSFEFLPILSPLITMFCTLSNPSDWLDKEHLNNVRKIMYESITFCKEAVDFLDKKESKELEKICSCIEDHVYKNNILSKKAEINQKVTFLADLFFLTASRNSMLMHLGFAIIVAHIHILRIESNKTDSAELIDLYEIIFHSSRAATLMISKAIIPFAQEAYVKDKSSNAGKAKAIKNMEFKNAVIQEYKNGKFNSTNDAANKIWNNIQSDPSKYPSFQLTQSRGKLTIYEWLLESSKQ